jgi:hypothetical protein
MAVSSLVRSINAPPFPRLRSLALACEIDGYAAQVTEPACPGIIATLVGHIVGRAPTLRTLSLHAVWSFVGQPDLSQPSVFYGQGYGHGRGGDTWECLDKWLSRHVVPRGLLKTMRVRATPHALCTASRLQDTRATTYPRLSGEALERANREMMAVFRRTRKRLNVQLWDSSDPRFVGDGGSTVGYETLSQRWYPVH